MKQRRKRALVQGMQEAVERVSVALGATPSGWWYLSYAGEVSFNGGAIVRAGDLVEAVREAHRLKLSPGGQVLGVPIPEDLLPGPEHRERLLLTREDVALVWPDAGYLKDLDLDEDEQALCEASTVEEEVLP